MTNAIAQYTESFNKYRDLLSSALNAHNPNPKAIREHKVAMLTLLESAVRTINGEQFNPSETRFDVQGKVLNLHVRIGKANLVYRLNNLPSLMEAIAKAS